MREKLVKYRSHSGKKKKKGREGRMLSTVLEGLFSPFFFCVCVSCQKAKKTEQQKQEKKKKKR